MPKFTKQERGELIQLIIESDIRRLSLIEIASFIKDKTSKDISINYISTLRNQIRQKGREYISLLSKSRDFYVSEYLTLIEGAKLSEGELYKIALDHSSTNQEKIAAHRELAKYKLIIAQLMDAIPIVSGLQRQEQTPEQILGNKQKAMPEIFEEYNEPESKEIF